MTIEELRIEVVKRGKAGALQSYSRPDQSHKLRGSLAGFDRALKLPLSPEQWEAEIEKLEKELVAMRQSSPSGKVGYASCTDAEMEKYWEKRCFQAEIQWTFSVLCIAWKFGKSISARATLAYADIVGVR